MFRVGLHPPRCWVFGHRVHHGLAGVALAAVGVALAAQDWHDRRVWLPDLLTVR